MAQCAGEQCGDVCRCHLGLYNTVTIGRVNTRLVRHGEDTACAEGRVHGRHDHAWGQPCFNEVGSAEGKGRGEKGGDGGRRGETGGEGKSKDTICECTWPWMVDTCA